MATLLKLLISATLICTLASHMAVSRPMVTSRTEFDEEGSNSCWDSLLELKSCTGEVVLFFLNGETYLGPNCCRAIKIIEHQCWPFMLGSIGINSEESDILVGYCDASSDTSHPEYSSLEAVAPAPSPISHD